MDRFDLKRPCQECPFRKGERYLRKERAASIAQEIDPRGGDNHFYCHKTSYCGEGEAPEDEKSICAGSIIVSLKDEAPGNLLRVGLRLGVLDPEELKGWDEVVDSKEDFIRQHGRAPETTK